MKRAALFAVLLAGCTAAEPATPWAERDSAGVRIVESRAPLETWSVSTEPTLALGETSEEGPTQFFRVVGIAFLPTGGFVVANQGTDQLRIFDSGGALVAEVGGRGNGPNEYSVLAHVWSLGDSILAYDFRNDRISIRDLSGALSRTFRLEWFAGGLVPETLLPDGTVMTVTGRRLGEIDGSGLLVDSALISRYDLTGALIDSLGRLAHNQRVVFSDGYSNSVLGLPFSENGRIAPGPDGYCYAWGERFELRCYARNGAPSLLVRTADEPRPIGPAEIAWYWDHLLEGTNPIAAASLRKHREAMVYPETFPAFADLLADRQGRTWAQVYPLPDAPAREWRVFESGRWVARLDVPAAFQVMAIGEDRLIGVWRDELGVESVRVYAIRRG